MKQPVLPKIGLRKSASLLLSFASLASLTKINKNNRWVHLDSKPQNIEGQMKRDFSILQALDWAFRIECAAMDFQEAQDGARPGISTVWVMMQRGALGCRIDGGGRSHAHEDAQIIASFVAALPEARGGRGMAAQIAELARAGMQPDWMDGARPRCLPREWSGKGGRFARTEVWETITTRHRGRKVKRDVMYCPVTFTPTAAQIARARRNWLDWWSALGDLRADLTLGEALRTIRLTPAMPPMQPWAPQDAVAYSQLTSLPS